MVEILSLAGLGLLVGFLSGLFGVGGGFVLVPLLNAVFNIPYNIAVGSSLCQMVGTSTAASLKHRGYGHVDYKLGILLLAGACVGAEAGAQVLMWLKGLGSMTIHGTVIDKMYVGINIIYTILLLAVGGFMFIESIKAKSRPAQGGVVKTRFAKIIQKLRILPNISLRVSGIETVSIWPLILLGFCVGLLSGLLGVGGGFVMTPSLIYLIGIPTSVAIGTDLFQIIFTAGYGTVTHFIKGNIDFKLVGCILAGSLIGSQLGAMLNKKMRGAQVRYYFSMIIFAAVAVIVIKFLYNIKYIGN